MSDSSPVSSSDSDRVSLGQKAAYGSGQVANMVLATAIPNLANYILNIGLGVSPALVGLALGLPRLWDAFIDPVAGYITDNTRTRWGRRKPYIACGGIAVGLCLALMWQLPQGWSEMGYFWFFLGMSLLFYVVYTIFVTPFVALGFELTTDYHERTRLMAATQLIGQIGVLPMPWLFSLMQMDYFDNIVQAGRVIAIGLGAVVIALVLVTVFFLRDPTVSRFLPRNAGEKAAAIANPPLSFFQGMKTTLKNPNFLRLCFATFVFFSGLIMVQSIGPYLIIYYTYGGDKLAAATLVGLGGTTWTVASLFLTPLIARLSTKIGKKQAFILCAGCALFGNIIKWFCYDPAHPYLNLIPGPFIAMGFAALWTLISSMLADVCDQDELDTGERREGTFSSVYWWIVKLGMSASFAISGGLLSLSGFDVALTTGQTANTILLLRIFDVAIPTVAIVATILIMRGYPLTEAMVRDIRTRLDASSPRQA